MNHVLRCTSASPMDESRMVFRRIYHGIRVDHPDHPVFWMEVSFDDSCSRVVTMKGRFDGGPGRLLYEYTTDAAKGVLVITSSDPTTQSHHVTLEMNLDALSELIHDDDD